MITKFPATFFGVACFLFIGPFACSNSNAQGALSFVNASDELVVSVGDASLILGDIMSTAVATDSRWSRCWEYIVDTEFGFWEEAQYAILQEARHIIEDKLCVRDCVAGFPNVDGDKWYIVCRTDSDDAIGALRSLEKCLALLWFKDDVKQKSGDSDGSGYLPDPLERDLNIVTFWNQRCFFERSGNLLLLSNSESLVGKLADKGSMKQIDEKGSLVASRVHQTLSAVMETKSPKSNSINVFIGGNGVAKVLSRFIGEMDESVARTWGLNEVSAFGLAVHFCRPSSSGDGSGNEATELIVDGFALVTQPRTGIFRHVELKGFPPEFPALPKDVALCWFINMDWKRYSDGLTRVKEEVEGAQSADVVTSQEAYRRALSEIVGNLRGQCWCYDDAGKIGNLDFKNINDVEKMSDLIVASTSKSSPSPGFVYERTELGGRPAVLAKLGDDQRIGTMFVEQWMYTGIEFGLLQSLEGTNQSDRLPSEFQAMVDDLKKFVRIDDEIPALLVVFPKAVEEIQKRVVSSNLKNKIVNDLRKGFQGDKKRFVEDYQGLMEKMEAFEFPKPRSRDECTDFAILLASKILSDHFSQWVFAGSDKGNGFRVSGKSFVVRE